MSRRSLSGEGIVKEQTKALKDKINEAIIAVIQTEIGYIESKRKKFVVDNANVLSPTRRRNVEKRYEVDRKREQETISQLMHDLETVKTKIVEGSLDVTSRSRAKAAPPIDTMNVDRFHKQVYLMDVNLNKEFIQNTNKYERAARRKMRPYNEYEEKRKLQLLIEKRDVLNRLATIQRSEIGVDDANTPRQRSHSVGSGMPTSRTTSTQASWATFATSRPATESHHMRHLKLNHNNLHNHHQQQQQQQQHNLLARPKLAPSLVPMLPIANK